MTINYMTSNCLFTAIFLYYHIAYNHHTRKCCCMVLMFKQTKLSMTLCLYIEYYDWLSRMFIIFLMKNSITYSFRHIFELSLFCGIGRRNWIHVHFNEDPSPWKSPTSTTAPSFVLPPIIGLLFDSTLF